MNEHIEKLKHQLFDKIKNPSRTFLKLTGRHQKLYRQRMIRTGINLVRKNILPKVAKEISEVQPMMDPTGQIFTLYDTY